MCCQTKISLVILFRSISQLRGEKTCEFSLSVSRNHLFNNSHDIRDKIKGLSENSFHSLRNVTFDAHATLESTAIFALRRALSSPFSYSFCAHLFAKKLSAAFVLLHKYFLVLFHIFQCLSYITKFSLDLMLCVKQIDAFHRIFIKLQFSMPRRHLKVT